MGWLQGKIQELPVKVANEAAQHVEDSQTESHRYAPVSMDTPDDNLPFIPSNLISAKSRPGRLAIKGKTVTDPERHEWWIVVNDIVYDCTDFILEHPGGEQVIMSFIGEDCSWQFRRFHSKRILDEIARPLRIGRAVGVKNRFKEPKRRAGLASAGNDEW